MKKFFLFLLIFILASPAISHACHCCDGSNDYDSSQASIQQKTPDYCQPMNAFTKECRNINITKTAMWHGSSVLLVEGSPAVHFIESAALPKASLLLGSPGSPPSFSENPFYLLYSVLRI